MKEFQHKNYSEALQFLHSKDYNRVLIQCPEGLLNKEFLAFVSEIQERCQNVFIMGDECFGACDLPLSSALELQIDVIVHIGHSFYHHSPLIPDLVYVTIDIDIDLDQFAEKIGKLCRGNLWNSLTLVGTIQHVYALSNLAKKLQLEKIDVLIPPNRGRLQKGQILGCETRFGSISTTDAILCVAGGQFHALAVMLDQQKPVISLDPFSNKIEFFAVDRRKKFLMKRYALIEKARDAEVWGVILGLKSGQKRPQLTTLAERWIKNMNKRAVTIVATRVDPKSLNNFSFIDAWVTTHCIRQSLDDYKSFLKPFLTVAELGVLCGEMAWETLVDGPYLTASQYPERFIKKRL